MKIAPSTTTPEIKSTLLLPLVPERAEELTRGNSISFELRSNPTEIDSPRYKKQVRVLYGNEDTRTVIFWIRETQSIVEGLNLTTYAQQYSVIKTLVRDTAYANFEQSVLDRSTVRYNEALEAAVSDAAKQVVRDNTASGYHHVEDITPAMYFVAKSTMPKKILQRVKRELRRSCRKPAGMKVRDYVSHICRINDQELPMIVPFSMANSLSDDEILDIVLYGTPRSWQAEMDRQGFDPLDNTLKDVMEFLERMESAEVFEAKSTRVDKGKENKSSSSKKSKSNSSYDRGGKKHCMLHGDNNTHNTAECLKLKAEAARLKGDGASKNNTWTKKAQDHKDKTRRDLNAIVQKAIKKGVRKELSNIESRKRDSDDDESSSDGEINLIESLGKFDINDINEAIDAGYKGAIEDCVDVDELDINDL